MPNRRGRPSKFGRPAKAIVLTLPDNVLGWLRSIHADPAWAIVSLFEQVGSRLADYDSPPSSHPELVQLSGKRALIVVNPSVLRGLDGVTVVPLADGRALIALDPGKGVADLELATLDRLERIPESSLEHAELTRLRHALRRWRGTEGLRFQTRSIIVVERPAATRPVRPALALASPQRKRPPRSGSR